MITRLFAVSIASLVSSAPIALAQVPTYSVEVIETFSVTTTVRGASNAGQVVGDQVIVGLVKPFIATLGDGVVELPLPDGYNSGSALDVNDIGVVVGTVSTSSLPHDFGEPAVWTPNAMGGYDVMIPEQFTTVPSPLGDLSVNGGQAVAINNNGDILGWSRYQGFQGGPSTMFSMVGAPVNLGELGFDATVRDVNDNGIAVGGRYRFDLNTMSATDLGLPDPIQPGNVSFQTVIAYSINNLDEVIVAADLASVPTENYLTYIHDLNDGYTRLNPAQLPSRFVGFYDNNDLGDVSASGGVYFAPEDTLVAAGYNTLLDPSDSNWSVALGYIANDRKVYTTAYDAGADINAIVVLVPDSVPCTADLNGDTVADFFDISELLMSSVDYNGDTMFDFFDISAFLQDLDSGCP